MQLNNHITTLMLVILDENTQKTIKGEVFPETEHGCIKTRLFNKYAFDKILKCND